MKSCCPCEERGNFFFRHSTVNSMHYPQSFAQQTLTSQEIGVHTQQGNFWCITQAANRSHRYPRLEWKLRDGTNLELDWAYLWASKNKIEDGNRKKTKARRYNTNQKEKSKSCKRTTPKQCGPHRSKTGVWRAYVGWSTAVYGPITSLVILLLFCHIIVVRHI